MKFGIFALLVSLSLSFSVFAQTESEVLNELRGTFKNTPVSNARESIIPGLYEVHAGSNVMYYYPEKKVLFFGEMYTAEGVNLTNESRNLLQVKQLSLLRDEGIRLGSDDAKNQVVEFTSPECGFCKQIHAFFSAADFQTNRTLIFDKPVTPKGRQKIEHLICEKDIEKRTADYALIMKDEDVDYKTCDEADDVIERHASFKKMMRVEGTPVLYVNSTRVNGVNLEVIRNLLL